MKTPKIVIIRTKKGQKYANFIGREIRKLGSSYIIGHLGYLKKILKDNNCSDDKTIIHSRVANPGYTYRVLKNLEEKGYRVINRAETIKLTSDKYTSCIYARKKGISCPQTVRIDKDKGRDAVVEKIKKWQEVIVKPITSQGQGEFCFKFNKDNIGEIEKKINQITGEEVVVQKYINYNRLNRVIVIGGEALGKAVFWDEPKNDWKCSVCLNFNIKHYQNPPKELLNFAENIAKQFKAEISFIDIFSTDKGYILNEINTACSLIIHEKISGYNISKEIAKYLVKCHKQL